MREIPFQFTDWRGGVAPTHGARHGPVNSYPGSEHGRKVYGMVSTPAGYLTTVGFTPHVSETTATPAARAIWKLTPYWGDNTNPHIRWAIGWSYSSAVYVRSERVTVPGSPITYMEDVPLAGGYGISDVAIYRGTGDAAQGAAYFARGSGSDVIKHSPPSPMPTTPWSGGTTTVLTGIKAQFLLPHNGRLWYVPASDRTTIGWLGSTTDRYATSTAQPTAVFKLEGRREVMGWFSHGGRLYIFVEDQLWMVTGTPPMDASSGSFGSLQPPIKIADGIGMIHRYTITAYRGAVYFATTKSAYRFAGGGLEDIGLPVQRFLGINRNTFGPKVATLSGRELFGAAAANGKWLLSTYEVGLLIYDVRTGQWDLDTATVSAAYVVAGGGDDVFGSQPAHGEFVVLSDTTNLGYLDTIGEEISLPAKRDGMAAATFFFFTKRYDFDTIKIKRLKALEIEAFIYNNTKTVEVGYITELGTTVVLGTITGAAGTPTEVKPQRYVLPVDLAAQPLVQDVAFYFKSTSVALPVFIYGLRGVMIEEDGYASWA